MDKQKEQSRYQANIKVGDTVIFTTMGNDYDELVALVNAKVESEASSTEGEIIDLATHESAYRCRKQAASE